MTSITVKASTRYEFAGSNITTNVNVRASMTQYSGWLGNRTFTFPYAPVEVSYSGLARAYNKISRPGDFPLLDAVNPQLMDVQMQFRVADPSSHGTLPIDTQLDTLRLMGLLPGPILVANMDAYLSRPIAPTVTFWGLKLAFFRMTDLSISVKRRDRQNRATQADVQMTLTEDRNPYVPAVAIPPIDYSDTPSRVTGSVSTDGGAPVVGEGGGRTFTDVAG